MAIHSLQVENFKGIAKQTAFELAPLTLFIGPNSSGKSSCIHALAAMSQTLKLGERNAPLILDDDAAQVHLGRFIEIIHSKSYTDGMTIGLELGDMILSLPTKQKRSDRAERPRLGRQQIGGTVRATYCFKSNRRTQEVYVSSAMLSIGDRELKITKSKTGGNSYRMTDSGTTATYPVLRTYNFMFEVDLALSNDIDKLQTSNILRRIQERIGNELFSTLYLGPFRQSPRRRYPFRGTQPSEVGAQGEAAVSLLASEHVQKRNRPHVKEIAKWLAMMKLGKSISVGRVGTSDLFGVDVTLPDSVSLPIADLGYGVSQVLSVLAQCSFANEGATLLFEQPELHLHPGAAGKLAAIFADVINRKNIRIVAETHSPDFFQGLFPLLNNGKLKPNQLAAYDVQRKAGQSVYTRIPFVNEGGGYVADHTWWKALEE